MEIGRVGSGVNFQYSSPLKTLYKQGKLPIKVGLYGGELTPANCSLEHVRCASKKGRTTLHNLALATKENNRIRGNRPISEYLTIENLEKYIEQFRGVVTKGFNGEEYIKGFLINLLKLLKEEETTRRKVYE